MDDELFTRSPHNPILTAANLPYRAHSVFNPAAVRLGDDVVLLLRVEDFRGHSHFAVARSADGETDWHFDPQPALLPDSDSHPEDAWGIEDPRAVYLPELDVHAVTFTSYSRFGPVVSLALTRDFITFERRGLIMPPDDKDAALLPRRFGSGEEVKEGQEPGPEKWLLIHRPSSADDPAHIKLSRSVDLSTWSDPEMLLAARDGGWWDANKIGLGPPPIETRAGWLVLYHGVRQTASGSLYRMGLALLDRASPWRVLARADDWVFGPEELYERTGDVPNVVFPSGAVLSSDGQQILLYYGAADTSICLARASLEDLLARLGV
jgi:predicted GH43/DUF377 family glycosyl hydrolase